MKDNLEWVLSARRGLIKDITHYEKALNKEISDLAKDVIQAMIEGNKLVIMAFDRYIEKGESDG